MSSIFAAGSDRRSAHRPIWTAGCPNHETSRTPTGSTDRDRRVKAEPATLREGRGSLEQRGVAPVVIAPPLLQAGVCMEPTVGLEV